MTNRQFMEMVINGKVSEEMVEYARAELAKLDSKNLARRSKPTKVQLENIAIKDAIVEAMAEFGNDVFKTSAEIAVMVEISTQKASALCKQLVEAGSLISSEIKVKGKGTRMGFAHR